MVPHQQMANAIRFLSVDAINKANSGHPGMPMGMADAATVLFTRFLKYDASRPWWHDRDRFVLSAGHGSMLLYSLLYLTGYEDIDLDQIKNFRQLGAKTAGHPEYGHLDGVEITTGPLGAGISSAVGMALGERMMAQRYGSEVVSHFTYAIAGDGCLMEGISHEACSLAGHLKLGKLIVLFDDNEICIDGPVSMTETGDQQARFRAMGWDVQAVDGHDPEAVAKAIEAAQKTDQPSLIACRTIIGKGSPNKQGTSATHGSPLGEEETALARKELDWPGGPFEVPADVLAEWRKAGSAGAEERKAWEGRLNALPVDKKATFERVMEGRLPDGWRAALDDYLKATAEEGPKLATRQSSQKVLNVLTGAIPEMIGGSADLTGSVGTLATGMTPVKTGDYSGNYIHYGVREHAMGAIMNGLALHGGFIPYSGTFLVFSDYCRPAVRLSALMNQRVVYVFTHDSIGLGEDGPTHQPVEHLSSLRAIPNLNVFRPADAVEAAECWAVALESDKTPSVMALTRQGLPALRREHTKEMLSAKGAYVLREANGQRKVTLLATGSEVQIAMSAAEMLESEGTGVAVVSMPCWELFDAQPAAYREAVLGKDTVRVAVEAASVFGWERYVGLEGAVVGMNTFGASGPIDELYKHFGITAEAVVKAVKAKMDTPF